MHVGIYIKYYFLKSNLNHKRHWQNKSPLSNFITIRSAVERFHADSRHGEANRRIFKITVPACFKNTQHIYTPVGRDLNPSLFGVG